METGKTTRRERQAEILKKEILEAAVKTFNQYGYDKATTKKIAQAAEVSEGTLYYYFENKRDIIITLFKKLISNITANLESVSLAKEDITDMLSGGMAHQYGQINTLPILTLFIHEARHDPEVKKIFSEMMTSVHQSATNLFKTLEREGKIRKVNHETMALLMTFIGLGYLTLHETGDNSLTRKPLKRITDEFAHILVEGLKPEK